MRLRTTYPGFTDAVNVFFDKLIPKIVPLQVTARYKLHRNMCQFWKKLCIIPCDGFVFQFKKGGPIIAVQLDDSYGSYAKDDRYMAFIKEVVRPLTSDIGAGNASVLW